MSNTVYINFKTFNKDGDIIRYERKDDMIFGEWQAQMMRDKGQSTEGIRVDKKIQVNPLFKGTIGQNIFKSEIDYLLS